MVSASAGAPGRAADQASEAELVRAFLTAVERRDFAAAGALVHEGFVMIYPGARRFTELEELAAFAKPRYRFVRKRFEGVETVGAGGDAVVWCRGTLEGEWPDGSPFAGIRFVDRFVVRDGKIAEQHVWNDMGELRPRS